MVKRLQSSKPNQSNELHSRRPIANVVSDQLYRLWFYGSVILRLSNAI